MEQETEVAIDNAKLIEDTDLEKKWQAEQAEREAEEAKRGPEDYYILFRDLFGCTLIDYDKRCRQQDWLLGDNASYVWGYVGKLTKSQAEAVETRLGLEFWEKFLAEHEVSGNGSRTGYGFIFDFTDVPYRDKPRARDEIAQLSPNLSFLTEMDPYYLNRFWFFPEHREMWRILQALGYFPNPHDNDDDEDDDDDDDDEEEEEEEEEDYVGCSCNVLELGCHVTHWSSVQLFSLRELEYVWKHVGYCQGMDILRHTAAALKIRGTRPWELDDFTEKVTCPMCPDVTKKTFLSLIHDGTRYVSTLTLRQLMILKECVEIVKSVREVDGCEDGFENVYTDMNVMIKAFAVESAELPEYLKSTFDAITVALNDPEWDEANKDKLKAAVAKRMEQSARNSRIFKNQLRLYGINLDDHSASPSQPQSSDDQAVSSVSNNAPPTAPKAEPEQPPVVPEPVVNRANNYETSADGRWVEADDFRVNHAPKVDGQPPSNRTLQDWRLKGKKAKDGKSGCDWKGYTWVRDEYDPTIIRYWVKHE